MPQITVNLIKDLREKHNLPKEKVPFLYGLRTGFLRAWMFTAVKVMFIFALMSGVNIAGKIEENVSLIDQLVRNDFGVAAYTQPTREKVVTGSFKSVIFKEGPLEPRGPALESGMVAAAETSATSSSSQNKSGSVAAANSVEINNNNNTTPTIGGRSLENYIDDVVRFNLVNAIAARYILPGTGDREDGCLQIDSNNVVTTRGSRCGGGGGGSSGGGTLTMGGAITGATQNSILFVGPLGVLAQDNTNFAFDDATNALTIGGDTNVGADLDVTGDGAIGGDITVTGLAGNGVRCLQTDNNGLVSVAGAACGAGGGQTPWTSNIDADGFDLQNAGAIDATSYLLSGTNINTAGTLTNVAYENQANVFTINQTVQKADPSIILDVTTATDTDFWLGVQEDAGGDDDDAFQIGDGISPGTNPFLTINTSGNVGIGDATPTSLLTVGLNDAFQVSSTGNVVIASQTTGVKGLTIGNISGASSVASGFVLGNISGGIVENHGIELGNITSVSGVNSIGIFTGSQTGGGGSSQHFGIYLGSMANAGLQNTGVNIQPISGAATTNTGINIGAVTGASNNYALITNGGNTGLGTTAPDRALEVNSSVGDNLRLTYNDSNGSAANYADLLMSPSGDLTITATGSETLITSNLVVGSGTSSSETLSNAGFTMGGDDLFVAGMAGVEGNIYTDGSVIAGTTTFNETSLAAASGQAFDISTDAAGLSFTVMNSGNITLSAPGTVFTNANASITGNLTTATQNLGDGAAGYIVTLGRNNNGTNTGAGSINFQSKAGTAGYVWQDNAGNLRIHTAAPTNANDTAGVVVGDQTSTRATKQNIEDYTDFASALQMVANAPLHTFRYKKDVQGYGTNSPLAKERIGYIADEVPGAFMWGNSIDQVSVNGILMASVKALNNKIEAIQPTPTDLGDDTPIAMAQPLYGNVTVVLESHLYLSEDSVGQAKILEGDTEVRINFTKAYEFQPIVTTTPQGRVGSEYWVGDKDSTGFTIYIDDESDDDITFDWHSFAGEGAKLTVSDGSQEDIVLIITQQNEPELGLEEQVPDDQNRPEVPVDDPQPEPSTELAIEPNP